MLPAPPVLTGFRAFPGVPANPTEALLAYLAGAPRLLPAGTGTALLDVDYCTVGPALDRLLEPCPAALVLTGYSHLARGITLERRATGLCAPDKPDVRGHVAEGPVGQSLDSALDLDRLAARIGAQVPCEVSHDAGQYLCNYAYRHALERVRTLGLSTQVLFVHVPAGTGTPLAERSAAALPLATLAAALALVVAELCAAYSPPE